MTVGLKQQLILVRRVAIAGAASTAIGAAGVVGVSPAAQAAPWDPPCQDWQRFGVFVINEANGWRMEVPWHGHLAKGPAKLFHPTQSTEPLNTGTVSGGITGEHLDFSITWQAHGTAHLVGDVDPEWGRPRGVVMYDDGQRRDWVANETFECFARAGQPAPGAAWPKPATVTGDVDVYNIGADEVAEEGENGIVGVKIGMLRAGQQVQADQPCKPNDWCKVLVPELPGGLGFVWGHLKVESDPHRGPGVIPGSG